MSQPSPHVSPLHDTLSPTGLSHPMSRVKSNGTGHTLRVKSTHRLGHLTEWVAPWVRSVPMESLDTPRSVHVASHEELQGIDHATWSLMLPIMTISPRQPNSSHSINETPGLLHSISTQRHTTFGGPRSLPLDSNSSNSWTTLVYSI